MASAPQIPGYRAAGVLGTGGFATVYRCWQLAVGREVAVKIDNRVLLSERDRRRFVREVTAAGRLSGHPHVIDVYDAGTLSDGRPYLVMELCPAGSLNDALRRRGPMGAAQVRDIGIRISDALAAAHAAGVLRRDIKPANILVNRYGLVGLSDFGLAAIMAAGGEQSTTREALTPAYASPETFRCEEPTVAADLYSLAATLYALLAGQAAALPRRLKISRHRDHHRAPRRAGGRCARRAAGADGHPAAWPGHRSCGEAAERRRAAGRPRHAAHPAGETGATGESRAAGVFGISTVTSGCPAAAVRAAGARCPRNPECWNGLNEISGAVTARSLPCTQPHVWETFAIAILPAGVRTFDQQTVAQNPVVSAVCSMRVLLESRLGAARQVPRASWAVDVMPPDEAAFDNGDRAYRCVAHRTSGPDPSTAQFGLTADRDGRASGGRGGPGSGKNG